MRINILATNIHNIEVKFVAPLKTIKKTLFLFVAMQLLWLQKDDFLQSSSGSDKKPCKIVLSTLL